MKNMSSVAKGQRGFTLIEIAIVLVIVGLLLGGVLQGQQLIENSRVRGAINDFKGIPAAAYSYMDRYSRMPGDDINAVSGERGAAWTDQVAGDANGTLGGTFVAATFTTGPTDEMLRFWQHLRAAGFIPGDPLAPGVSALPQNPFGGLVAVTSAQQFAMPANTNKVCMNNVPGSAAAALDNELDDGDKLTGAFRGNDVVLATVPAGTYDEGLLYIVCMRM